ncbi:hypothetical protein YC6258_02371 [Gynuella sunshinyii YC6258]|uniref:DUF2333 family protein n=2 Tax=Gynuella sunshinyii TaxID=1445505 RepID=A0A0C5VVD6_9GAMM|nr:hypothetical protein YC6258_02371 [Gynuella sunshinyii YC6258]
MWARLPLNGIVKTVLAVIALYLLIALVLGMYWSNAPDLFDVKDNAREYAQAHNQNVVVGYTTVATLHRLASSLLDKPGGYLSNDVTPPGVWLDNMPNWEFGVLIQVRDLSRALRKDIARSQSQSKEDPDLAQAEPAFNFQSDSWILPATEGEYRSGINYLEAYMDRLADPSNSQAQFYARADNLRNWLTDVETRLGSLSQRLSASVGQVRMNTDLAGDAAAEQSTGAASQELIKTGWFEIDDVFYEARGTAWALTEILRAVEVDFASVLEKKNALVSLQQIIRELEATQETIWAPMILNGSGFGLVANHSLVMANYISRANAAIIDLRRLLENG